MTKGIKYEIVATDYYSKWVEVGPLIQNSKDRVINFKWNNLIGRFGVPYTLVPDNGTQLIEINVRIYVNNIISCIHSLKLRTHRQTIRWRLQINESI